MSIAPERQVLVSCETSEPYIPVQRKQVTRGFIFVFIYIELSQIYKSLFKLNIKGNSHIVQDERKQISCESPLAWRRLYIYFKSSILFIKQISQSVFFIYSRVCVLYVVKSFFLKARGEYVNSVSGEIWGYSLKQ